MEQNPDDLFSSKIYKKILIECKDTLNKIFNSSDTGQKESYTISEIINSSYLKHKMILLTSIKFNEDIIVDELKDFVKFAEDRRIYDIRAIVAHPKSYFPSSYWYDLASVCLHKSISKYFPAIKKILQNCENNTNFEDCPEEWYIDEEFTIPNNLSQKLDHFNTGFIGRKKEKSKLIDFINSNTPCLAVVAPGGLGKTALVDQTLLEIVSAFEYIDKVSSIIKISLKEESLALSGEIELEENELINKPFIENIESALEEFNLSSSKDSSQKIILYIDNFETLTDEEFTEAEDYLLNLGHSIKVIITTRIRVDGFKTLLLKGFSEGESINYAYKCLEAFSGSFDRSINEETLTQRVKELCFNPLAIKNYMYALSRGSGSQNALESAKSDIINFSYRNIIDNLSNEEKKILETLYVLSEADKISLSNYTDLSSDMVDFSVSELLKPGLIEQSHNKNTSGLEVTKIILNNFMRAYLGSNILIDGLREKILDQRRKKTVQSREIAKNQQSLNIDRNHPNYIPDDIQPDLKCILDEVLPLISYKSGVPKLKFADAKKFLNIFQLNDHKYSIYPHFNRVYAIIHYSLGDHELFRRHILKAIEIGSQGHNNHLTFLSFLISEKFYEEAYEFFNAHLKDSKHFKVSTSRDRTTLGYIHAHYVNILSKLKLTDEILDFTDNWISYKDIDHPCNNKVIPRIKVLLTKATHLCRNSRYLDSYACLFESLEIFVVVFEVNDKYESAMKLRNNFNPVISSLQSNEKFEKFDLDHSSEYFKSNLSCMFAECFCSIGNNLFSSIESSKIKKFLDKLDLFIKHCKSLPVDHKKDLIITALSFEDEDNPFNALEDRYDKEFGIANEEFVRSRNLELVELVNKPIDRNITDKYGRHPHSTSQIYFQAIKNEHIRGLAHKSCATFSASKWSQLKVGDILAIVPVESPNSDKYNASEIYIYRR